MAKKVKPVLKSIQYPGLCIREGKNIPLLTMAGKIVSAVFTGRMFQPGNSCLLYPHEADPHEFWCVGQVSIKINIDALKPARSTRHVTGKSHQFPALIR